MKKLFPNPASDVVSISYELVNANTEVEIYDLAGRSISKHALSETRGELQVNTSAYQSGVYIVVVKQNNMITWQQKLVIE